MKRLVLLFAALLVAGCGEKSSSEGSESAGENPTAPSEEVKPVEEKQQEVKPEEPVAETKPAEAVSVSPHLKYETEGDAVTITGCDKKVSGALSIPAVIEGNPVTSIGSYAFDICTNLTSITIPDSVTSIEGYAFLHCTSLTSITIPDSVTSIDHSTFAGCTALTSIEVGAGNVNYTEVNGVLFNTEKTVLLTYPAGKTGANYTIPDSVTSIGLGAFAACTSLTSITIGDNVTSIGDYAFMGCTSLTSITIPDSVTSIGGTPFDVCTSLTTIEVDAGNVNYTDVDGVLFNTEKTVLLTYPAGKTGANYNIPDSVTSIGEGAFAACTSLTSITIPDSVTSIGNGAFGLCSSLTSITIGERVTSIGENAFLACSSLTAVTFLGDAPKAKGQVFSSATPTVYRKPEAKGWGETFGGRPGRLGRPVKLISEKP